MLRFLVADPNTPSVIEPSSHVPAMNMKTLWYPVLVKSWLMMSGPAMFDNRPIPYGTLVPVARASAGNNSGEYA